MFVVFNCRSACSSPPRLPYDRCAPGPQGVLDRPKRPAACRIAFQTGSSVGAHGLPWRMKTVDSHRDGRCCLWCACLDGRPESRKRGRDSSQCVGGEVRELRIPEAETVTRSASQLPAAASAGPPQRCWSRLERIWHRAWRSALKKQVGRLSETISRAQLPWLGMDAPRADPKRVIRLPKASSDSQYGRVEPFPRLESQQGKRLHHRSCLYRNPRLLPLPAGDSASSQGYR